VRVSRIGRYGAATAAFGCIASACTFGPQFDQRSTPEAEVVIAVVDEAGAPIDDAQISIGNLTTSTDGEGLATISIDAPVVATITAPDTLDEPVAIGPTDGAIDVQLWSRVDAEGRERNSLHFGGDVMLGRRYLDPELSTPYVDDAESARFVVEDVAPLSAAADFTSVNLETVVGNLPDSEALPAKRFLLQSSPLVTESLDEMGVDLVTLGNNHAYDWGEIGITTTFDILEAAEIPHVGAGNSRDEAVRGEIVEVNGMSLGVVSLTTVTGSYVNDQLPDADDEVPDDLDPSEAWQYEQRMFGFRDVGGTILVESRLMRIREVWDIVEEFEDDDAFTRDAELWTAATDAFPELQDWVARRGHGGAAPYRRSEMESELARLRSAGADMLVVQVHGGFQFAEVNSSFLRSVSHAAIDAGADAVVSHHPHVLQGVEWYGDGLIVYSLGNLVFDQGFSATFPSAMLRVITNGDEILEARMLPIMLDRYRPLPVVGDAAQTIIRMVDARTASPAVSARISGLEAGSVVDVSDADSAAVGFAGSVPNDRAAAVVFDRNTGLIVRDRVSTTLVEATPGTTTVELAPCALVRNDDLDDGTQIGTDIFDWGGFDVASARLDPPGRRLPINWLALRDAERWNYTDGPSGSPFDRAMELFTDTDSTTTMRMSARVDVDAHRLFDTDGRPLDAPAEYEIIMDVRRMRGEEPSIRLVSFDFDDSDPTTDPDTERLNEVVLSIPVPDDEVWHRVSLPVPPQLFAPGPDGHVPNTAMLLIDAPPALRGQLAIDNLSFIEWRGATDSPYPTWVEGDVVRSTGARVELTTTGC